MPTITPTTEQSEPTIRDVLVAIDGLGSRMDRFEHRMDRFENRMDRIEESASAIVSQMRGLGTRMGGLESEVGGVRVEVGVLTDKVEKLDNHVGETNERITSAIAFSAVNIRRLTEESNEVRGSLGMAPGQMVTMAA
jgi:archaellum component FlaC